MEFHWQFSIMTTIIAPVPLILTLMEISMRAFNVQMVERAAIEP